MDINHVINLCEGFGKVQRLQQNQHCFGNIEIEIRANNKKTYLIASDRGELLCYEKRRHLLSYQYDLIKQINYFSGSSFEELFQQMITYLKANLQ